MSFSDMFRNDNQIHSGRLELLHKVHPSLHPKTFEALVPTAPTCVDTARLWAKNGQTCTGLTGGQKEMSTP